MRLIDADDFFIQFSELDIEPYNNVSTIEERPKGKWLKSSNMSKRSYQRLCSNCKHIVYFCGDGNYPNCPYCLADMRGDV